MYIRDLLPSPTLAELLQLRVPVAPGEVDPANWFSVDSAVRVRDHFQSLDADGNGHLSQTEFAGSAHSVSVLYTSS